MFEALISLTLLAVQPPLGNAGIEWAKEIRSFSSEVSQENENRTSQSKSTSDLKASPSDLDLSISEDEMSAARVTSFLDGGILSGNKVTTAHSEQQNLPSYEWFKKHQNWISIDRRILNTRGDDTLFQDWSPL